MKKTIEMLFKSAFRSIKQWKRVFKLSIIIEGATEKVYFLYMFHEIKQGKHNVCSEKGLLLSFVYKFGQVACQCF
jgi:hypothetical protein